MKAKHNHNQATRHPASRETAPHFALSTISFREKLLEFALDSARDLGFPAVEIWGREPHISEKFDENRVHAARKMVEERGLALPVLASYLTLGPVRTRPEELVELSDVLHTARCLRTPIVRIWASDLPSDRAAAKVWSRTVGEIQDACDRAARLNLTLAAEMHDDTLADTGAGALRLFEEVHRDNFRLVFQVSSRPRDEEPLERLRLVSPWVVHTHICNFHNLARDESERARRAPIAEGLVDFLPLVEMLADNGYQGHYTLEFAAREGDGKLEALAQDLNYLRSLFRLLGLTA